MKFSKKVLSFLLVCLLAFSMVSISVSASDLTFTDGNFDYYIDDDFTYATLVGTTERAEGESPIKEAVIPNDLFGLPVVAIGADAFVNNCDIISVTFEEGTNVTSIGADAFSFCKSLKSITLPSAIDTIEEGTFYGCSALEMVEIGAKSISVNNKAFYNCTSLKSFDTNKIASLGESSFFNSGLESIIIEDAVTEIPELCFAYCSNLKIVKIKGKSTEVASDAFYNNKTNDIKFFCNIKSLAADMANANGYTYFYFGDVNINNSVNILDVTYLQAYIVKKVNLSDDALIVADVNFDGKVNILDASVIQAYLCRRISEF